MSRPTLDDHAVAVLPAYGASAAAKAGTGDHLGALITDRVIGGLVSLHLGAVRALPMATVPASALTMQSARSLARSAGTRYVVAIPYRNDADSVVLSAYVGVGEWIGPRRGVDVLWNRGGFPDSLLAAGDDASLTWRRDFIRSYLERDVPMFAPRFPVETIARLWGMLAHGQGTLLNQSRLASSLGVSAPAVARYVDLLVDLLLVRRLQPWSGNIGKRFVRSPKLYVRDSGLVHALLQLERWDDVLGHPVAGPSWEGFVIENLIQAAGDRRVPCFYRTADGSEIDLVLERGGRVEIAVEIKRSTAPEASKGFRLGCEATRARQRYIVHGGSDEWPMAGGVTAIPLSEMVQRLRETA